jgi:hypothetical protein
MRRVHPEKISVLKMLPGETASQEGVVRGYLGNWSLIYTRTRQLSSKRLQVVYSLRRFRRLELTERIIVHSIHATGPPGKNINIEHAAG